MDVEWVTLAGSASISTEAAESLPGRRQAAARSEEPAPEEAAHSSAVTGEAFVDFYFSPLEKKKINLVLKTLYSKYKNAFVR